MKMMIWIFLLCGVFSGCSTFKPWVAIEKSEYVDTARGFKASVPVGWMRLTHSKDFFITYDGELLNDIIVEKSRLNTDLVNTKRKFLPEMTPQELAEVQIDSLKSNPNITNVVINSNKPTTVDGMHAFLLDYTCFNKDGLQYQARNIGFIYENWIYLISYEAPAQHYFAKYVGQFEAFLASFQLIK
ncbi:MAG: hypothetical protein H6754_02095 [Candidatus Omnitrophica bacterium]|nr:hypothetical protein [Candidatus Omnitrophota bacterium]